MSRPSRASRRSWRLLHLSRQSTNVIDDNLPTEAEKDASSSNAVDSLCVMIESVEQFTAKDDVKALMSLGDAWKPAF